jgi:hypothetical protein
LKNQAKKKTLQKKEWLPLNLKNQSFFSVYLKLSLISANRR